VTKHQEVVEVLLQQDQIVQMVVLGEQEVQPQQQVLQELQQVLLEVQVGQVFQVQKELQVEVVQEIHNKIHQLLLPLQEQLTQEVLVVVQKEVNLLVQEDQE
tara:strand:- start:43 stop:348 length:306 start_codon:yes stop_codon:yes gene_type:complete